MSVIRYSHVTDITWAWLHQSSDRQYNQVFLVQVYPSSRWCRKTCHPKKNHNKLIKSTESILALHTNCKNENIVFHMKHPMFHVGLRLIQKDGLEKTMKGKKRPQKTTPERELKIYRNLPISAGPVSFCLLAHQSNICGGRFIEQVSIQYKSNSKPRSVWEN